MNRLTHLLPIAIAEDEPGLYEIVAVVETGRQLDAQCPASRHAAEMRRFRQQA